MTPMMTVTGTLVFLIVTTGLGVVFGLFLGIVMRPVHTEPEPGRFAAWVLTGTAIGGGGVQLAVSGIKIAVAFGDWWDSGQAVYLAKAIAYAPVIGVGLVLITAAWFYRRTLQAREQERRAEADAQQRQAYERWQAEQQQWMAQRAQYGQFQQNTGGWLPPALPGEPASPRTPVSYGTRPQYR